MPRSCSQVKKYFEQSVTFGQTGAAPFRRTFFAVTYEAGD